MGTQEFFTPVAFDFLWEAMGIGEIPYPLNVRSHGATEDERIALRQRVNIELQARGIRDEHGRLEPQVEDWLVTLARPTTSIDALHIPDYQAPPIGILAASDGKNGVVAIQDANGIWIRPAFAEGLASAVVDLLPPGKRGTEASITLPLEEALRTAPIRVAVSAAGQQPDAEDAKKRRERARTPLSERETDPRQAYAQLSGQPRLRGGQLAANSRSATLGSRQRSPVLAWFDTATGRYLSLSRAGTDGREWVTISPADPKTLRMRLGEMLRGVAEERR
ncbi:ESX secretion-associated protein EspG [Amycolatopsis nigrescens]|uniref:ESX secretion-associated protein EspG n=1 Tax=Amycolatopsis nigrescens TaxID=381445 RepID=UPI0003797F6D|nr:ESX secretion-associated protein EspG [Amycolatopsis nigrescens]